MSQLKDEELVETGLKNILDELNNLSKFKKSNYQECINALDKLLNVLVGGLKSKSSLKSSYDKVDVGVSAIIQYIDKIIQTDGDSIEMEITKVAEELKVSSKKEVNLLSDGEIIHQISISHVL